MRSGFVVSSLALALALASPAFAQQSPTTMPQGQAPAHMQQQSGQKQHLSQSDKKFVHEAAMDGMAEVELGKLAQQHAQNAQVKQFGERMERDHSAANNELNMILAKTDVTVSHQLDQKDQRTIGRLGKLRGAEFDRAYMRQMVEDHDKDVKLFRQEAQRANDPDIKAFAQKTLPILEQHQQLAHEIDRSLIATGSSREPEQRQKNR